LTERLALHVVTRERLREPDYGRAWQWPEGIQPLGGSTRELLLNNPLAVSEADPVQIVATTGAQVVGRVNLISGRLQVDAQDLPVLWGSGLDVAERFRHTGAGLMLMLRMGSIHPTVCVVGISKIVTPIYAKLRWEIFPMQRYVLLRHSAPVLGRYLGSAAAALARPFAGALLSVHSGLLRTWIGARASRFRVEEVQALPAELDAQLAATRAPAACHRSSTWVNWLLAHHTGTRRLFVVHADGGKALGYFLVTTKFHATASSEGFQNLTLGSIKDWVALAPDELRELDLLLLATRELCRDPAVDAIEVCLPEDAPGRALRRLGFLPKGDLKFLFKAAPGSPVATAPFRDRSRWWFRPADGDNFFF
jgi:hypothetical protein